MIITEFHERLRALRKERRLRVPNNGIEYSQVWVAKTLGVARQTYLDVERGKVSPRLEFIIQLARLLDVDPGYLAFGKRPVDFEKQFLPGEVVISIGDSKYLAREIKHAIQ